MARVETEHIGTRIYCGGISVPCQGICLTRRPAPGYSRNQRTDEPSEPPRELLVCLGENVLRLRRTKYVRNPRLLVLDEPLYVRFRVALLPKALPGVHRVSTMYRIAGAELRLPRDGGGRKNPLTALVALLP